MRNPHLTPGMERVLKALLDEETDLIVEGRMAYVGNDPTSVATVYRLLRLCLIRDDSKDGAMSDVRCRYYSINEDGRRILADPKYVPLIVLEMKKMANRKKEKKS